LPRFIGQALAADCRLLWQWDDPMPLLSSLRAGWKR